MAFVPENHLGSALFHVDPATVVMTLLEGTGPAPARIIHAGDTIELQIDWTATGDAAFLALQPAGTSFVPTIHFDARGGGVADPASITGAAVPLVAAANHNYSTVIPLTPSLGNAGAYELTIMLKLVDNAGAPTFVYWHGFDEIPIVEVYP